MMPPPDHQNPVDIHTSITCINIMKNIKAVDPKLQEDKPCSYMRTDEKNVQLPIILRIFDENQSPVDMLPVDMHTYIMCIHILQNIKAVALTL